MGTLLSSQARALIKLPRGNQNEVVRVILAQKLSSRQCELLAGNTYWKHYRIYNLKKL